jgi:hypothetical protein
MPGDALCNEGSAGLPRFTVQVPCNRKAVFEVHKTFPWVIPPMKYNGGGVICFIGWMKRCNVKYLLRICLITQIY